MVMKPFSSGMRAHAWRTHNTLALAIGGLLLLANAGVAQTTVAASAPHAHSQAAGQATATSVQDQELQKQIAELRAQVAKLQAALEQQQKQTPQTPTAAAPASTAQAPGRRMMGDKPAMPPGGMPMGEMGGMGSGGMGGGQKGAMSGGAMQKMQMMEMMEMMDMHKGEMGMPPEGMTMPDDMMSEMGMGSMSGAAGTSSSSGMTMGGGSAGGASSGSGGRGGMSMGAGGTSAAAPAARSSRPARSMSSLPGVPGASHVYHIGSTGFFLDQPQLNLTTQQQTALNRIKERALLERGNAERRIEQAEQELWTLTGADQPDAAKVQAKLQEIEQLRTNQRIGFIRAVGEATKQLTAEQQNALLGTTPPTK